ncbi:unnamed protein product [Ilex paraguariensis]|uniref:Uncharacterized protein n=1 Tax=Ilex paraguariensis TaxID=185542 RepID=A0ABC8T5I3_9AQUA
MSKTPFMWRIIDDLDLGSRDGASNIIGTGTFGCGNNIVEGEDFIRELHFSPLELLGQNTPVISICQGTRS